MRCEGMTEKTAKAINKHDRIPQNMDISIGISCYNNFSSVNRLLKNIKEVTATNLNYKIIVCDDGSKEIYKLGLREIVKKYEGEVALVEHMENYGISAAWNTLAGYHGSKYTVLLNDDILLVKNWLTAMAYFFQKNRDIGSVGLLNYHGLNPETARKLAYDGIENPNAPIFTLNPPGCCFAFTDAVWMEVGGFDENMKSFYEECDFGTRCLARNLRNYVLPYPWIYHEWSGTFSRNSELRASERMNHSREVYKRKWGGDLREMFDKFVMHKELKEVRWLSEGEEKHGMPKKPNLDNCPDI
jgi:GT2 family glycosyltransferase